MKEHLNISLIQSNLFWENTKKNISNLSVLISRIEKTDVILLPEMFNTAFCPNSIHLAETMTGTSIKWMIKIAKDKKCAISGSLMIRSRNKIYNRLVWVSKNGEISTYDKRHLFSLIKEDRFITKGGGKIIVTIEGWRICPLICYDLRFPVFSRNNVNYDVLIYLANWPNKRIDAWNTLLKARAIENQCYTIGVNRVGEDGNGVPFNGNSKIYDAFGNKLIAAEEDKESVLQINLSVNDLKLKRRQRNFLQDRDDFTLN